MSKCHLSSHGIYFMRTHQFSSVTQSCLTLCNPMDCSMPGFPVHCQVPCSNSCPLSWWCHPTISSPVVPFSSCLQSFPASGSFPMNQFFTSGGQSIGVSASVISPSNEYSELIPFRMDWLDLLAIQGTLKSLQHDRVQLSHPYMTTGKTRALTRWTFVGKVMSLLFNTVYICHFFQEESVS